jgi:hypothetical protein
MIDAVSLFVIAISLCETRQLLPGRAGHASDGRRSRGQPLGGNELPTADTAPVGARVEALDSDVQLGKMCSGLIEQRRELLALERECGAFRVMLVIGRRRFSRLKDRSAVAGKPVDATYRVGALGGQRQPNAVRRPAAHLGVFTGSWHRHHSEITRPATT